MADNKSGVSTEFVMEKLMDIVKDLECVNSEVETSFKSISESLKNVELVINQLKEKSHTQEHHIVNINNMIKSIMANSKLFKETTERKINAIESRLKGYMHKPNWGKIVLIFGGIATAAGSITAVLASLESIKAFFAGLLG